VRPSAVSPGRVSAWQSYRSFLICKMTCCWTKELSSCGTCVGGVIVRCVFLAVHLNANRHVTGVLRGFDQFMNLVLDNTVDEKLKVDIGMVVVRGNSIITIEALEQM
jgi:small nuclear ribonucleoprotein G